MTDARPDLESLADRALFPRLASALAPWLTRQRWFAGKARVVTGVDVEDAVLLSGQPGPQPGVLVAFAMVTYSDGSPERYQVPLVARDADGPDETAAEVHGLPLADALADEDGCRALAALTAHALEHRSTVGGTFTGQPVGEEVDPSAATPRALGAEQSNTSIVLDERWILKVFRKLEDGVNPDVEITGALTASGFEHVPPQHGAAWIDYGQRTRSLAVLSGFVPRAQEGWARACAEAERVRSGESPGDLAGEVPGLGEVLSELHEALRDVFSASPATAADGQAWARDMRRQARHVLDLVAVRSPGTGVDLAPRREEIVAGFDRLGDQDDLGPMIRTHGDLHLGQVLFDEERGWLFLDFEGEPNRPLAERRAPHSPLRDVAGMLRSFDYAAAHATREDDPRLISWRDELREGFLDAYLARAEAAGLLPRHAQQTRALLAAFELDKAVYELGYELANRPSWLGIPAGGILRILAGKPAGQLPGQLPGKS